MVPNTPISTADTPTLAVTKEQYEQLLALAIRQYHATPHPGLGKARVVPDRLRSKAAEEKFEQYLQQALNGFARPGDVE